MGLEANKHVRHQSVDRATDNGHDNGSCYQSRKEIHWPLENYESVNTVVAIHETFCLKQSGVSREYHICPTCFRRLEAWLKEQGCQVEERPFTIMF